MGKPGGARPGDALRVSFTAVFRRFDNGRFDGACSAVDSQPELARADGIRTFLRYLARLWRLLSVIYGGLGVLVPPFAFRRLRKALMFWLRYMYATTTVHIPQGVRCALCQRLIRYTKKSRLNMVCRRCRISAAPKRDVMK